MKRSWPLILVLLGGCAAFRALFPERRPSGMPERAIKIPGAEARAAGVAFGDFVAQVKAEIAAARSRGRDGGIAPEELQRLQAEWACYERPDFYDAWVYLDDAGTRFVVEVMPKPEVCFGKGEELYGGGANYEIDAKSFDILKKDLQE